jgi:hypothetical protein
MHRRSGLQRIRFGDKPGKIRFKEDAMGGFSSGWKRRTARGLVVVTLISGCSGDRDTSPIVSDSNLQKRPSTDIAKIELLETAQKPVSDTGDGALTAERIRRIVIEHLRSGMEVSDARDVLIQHGLHQVGLFTSGSAMTEGYGTDDIDGPRLSVYSSGVSWDQMTGRLSATINQCGLSGPHLLDYKGSQLEQRIDLRELGDDTPGNN